MTTFTVRRIIADAQDIPGAVEDVIVYGAGLVVLGREGKSVGDE